MKAKVERAQPAKSVVTMGVIERLLKSKQEYEAECRKRGNADGIEWAAKEAEYGQLKNLSRYAREVYTRDDEDGALGTVLWLIAGGLIVGDDIYLYDDDDLCQFWSSTLGKTLADEHDKDEPDYWDSFISGARSVYMQLEGAKSWTTTMSLIGVMCTNSQQSS